MADNEKDQGPATQTLPFDPTTMNAEGALEAIGHINPTDPNAVVGYGADLATLQALKAAELDHPKYQGGRKTVLDALDEKIVAFSSPETPADEPSADEPAAEPAPEPVIAEGRRIPMAGEKDWHARIGASLIPVEILGDATAYRVRTTQGHPREVVVERSELIAG